MNHSIYKSLKKSLKVGYDIDHKERIKQNIIPGVFNFNIDDIKKYNFLDDDDKKNLQNLVEKELNSIRFKFYYYDNVIINSGGISNKHYLKLRKLYNEIHSWSRQLTQHFKINIVINQYNISKIIYYIKLINTYYYKLYIYNNLI